MSNVNNLKNGACRWPIGDPKDNDFHFCSAHSDKELYCDMHMDMAYNGNTQRRAPMRPKKKSA